MKNSKGLFDRIGCFVLILLFFVVCWLFLKLATSPEVCYTGEHDSQCEVMLNGGDYAKDKCGCYERLLEADRKRSEELRKKENKHI